MSILLLRHPIAIATLALASVRVLSFSAAAAFTGGVDSAARVQSWVWGSLLHFGFTLALGASLLAMWWLLRVRLLRVVWTAAALLLLCACLFLSLSDPILIAIIGERLTPSTLQHFAGPGLFVSDYFWKPVIAYWPAVGLSVAVLMTVMIWLVRLFATKGMHPEATPVAILPVIVLFATGSAASISAQTILPETMRPIEMVYAQELSGRDGVTLAGSEEDAIQSIRAFVDLPQGAQWADDRFPLVYRWTDAAAQVSRKPDIFVVVVESMRGQSLSPFGAARSGLAKVPTLEALARTGVVFQRYLATGFPSGPGFVGISSGAWMHPVKRLDAAFADTVFDKLGKRLRSWGYRTGIVAGDMRYDDKSNWVLDVFEDVRDNRALGLAVDDAAVVKSFIGWVEDADKAQLPRPLFGMLMTTEPHLPYVYRDATGQFTFGKDLRENYNTSIGQVDNELGHALAFLKARDRWNDTVIIVVGDHANFLDQGTSSGLPVDDAVFTGAIISGGHASVARARTSLEPASHADLVPTILALTGDRRPSVALGRDLLASPGNRRPLALAIRNGGSRLEMGDKTVMLPDHASAKALISRSSLLPDGQTGHGEMVHPPSTIAEAVRVWTWMIENNRVWSEDFLKP